MTLQRRNPTDGAAITLSLTCLLTYLQIIGFGRLEALRAGTRWGMSISCIETSFTPIDLDVILIAVSLHFINSKA